ncbi:hypothetical protein CVIRNUC_005075 [Coccomyxa viridis]|uniref:Cytochrome b561 domain-containing protein n=1 Tax=Coccomyxa viridis TaxID=1274662 RepID=A0AAV1I585_9CHLO|nr:hypothetical protein CVIRNUC_005075 [Coccomyxa viridis]
MRWFVTSIHILVIGCAVSIPVAIFNGTLFSWHPTLMSMAFLGFMAEGVLTSISFRALDGQDRVKAIQRHLVWQLAAFVCLVGGFYAIYRNKVVHGKAHFTSWHAKVGLTVFILSIVAPLGGVASFRKFGLLQRMPEKLQPRIKWAHRNIGLVTWLFALLAIELALPHHAVWKGWLSGLWQVCVVLLGAAVLALALLTPSHANAQSSPEFELVMEGRSKRTPESSSAAV